MSVARLNHPGNQIIPESRGVRNARNALQPSPRRSEKQEIYKKEAERDAPPARPRCTIHHGFQVFKSQYNFNSLPAPPPPLLPYPSWGLRVEGHFSDHFPNGIGISRRPMIMIHPIGAKVPVIGIQGLHRATIGLFTPIKGKAVFDHSVRVAWRVSIGFRGAW